METLKAAIPESLKRAIGDSNADDLQSTCSSLHRFFLHFDPFHQVNQPNLLYSQPIIPNFFVPTHCCDSRLSLNWLIQSMVCAVRIRKMPWNPSSLVMNASPTQIMPRPWNAILRFLLLLLKFIFSFNRSLSCRWLECAVLS